jgi:hypothetical protein
MQELEIEALGDGHGSDEGAPGEALSEFADNSHAGSDQDVMTIDHDARDEDVAQQSARGTQSITDLVSGTTQAAKAPGRRLAADVARCQRLERLLNQSKKANAELRNQLQQLYRNDAIAQVRFNSFYCAHSRQNDRPTLFIASSRTAPKRSRRVLMSLCRRIDCSSTSSANSARRLRTFTTQRYVSGECPRHVKCALM